MTQCRTDNGLCFDRIAQPYGAQFAYFHFVDGETYKFSPLKSIELYHIVNGLFEAGCWFNKVLVRRRNFSYSKSPPIPSPLPPGWLDLEYKGKHLWTLTTTPS